MDALAETKRGIGMKGPGKQIETDRRIIRERISILQKLKTIDTDGYTTQKPRTTDSCFFIDTPMRKSIILML